MKTKYQYGIQKPATLRVFLFADPIDYEEDFSQHKELYKFVVQKYNKTHKAKVTLDFQGADVPNFEEKHFDILLFDWGGMSIGNSLLEHFSNRVLKMAENYPSRYFIIVSTFTGYAVKEALEEFKDTELHNIVFDDLKFLDDFEEGKIIL